MKQHKNNIGVFRLLFASLVIIGHAPEMIDGDRTREPMTVLFHTVSLGELSVDAFFLLSGFLLAGSMLSTGSVARFLQRRVLRIYPAFVLSYSLSVFVLGPLVGARPWREPGQTLLHLVLLEAPPSYPGQFPGMRFYPDLNAALWTISYEFRCYLMVAAFGALGLLRRKALMLGLAVALLALRVATSYAPVQAWMAPLENNPLVHLIVGRPISAIHLTSAFMVGVVFYLYRDSLLPRLDGRTASACVLVAAIALYRDPHFAELFLLLFGGAALFWAALKAPLGRIQRVNDRWDISYGVYLYGWPVASYIRWLDPAISPWGLAVLTLPIAMGLGAASWFGLEKWAMAWGRAPARARSPLPSDESGRSAVRASPASGGELLAPPAGLPRPPPAQ
jgi:peptidoglycan/LPS O-acetylase OafA/YrhL